MNTFTVPTMRRITGRTVSKLQDAINREFRLPLATCALANQFAIRVSLAENHVDRAPYVKAFANGFLSALSA